MTFDQLKDEVCGRMNLAGTEAKARVATSINRHYKRVTSQLNLDATRRVTRSATTTNGVATVTFSSIEKIDRVLDTSDATAIRLLTEVSYHQIRSTQPTDGAPSTYAIETADHDSITIRLDTVPQTTYSLQADGWSSLEELTGSDVPAFPESYHDILTWFVLSEEYDRKEKPEQAASYERRAKELLADLKFQLADSATLDLRQNSGFSPASSTGGSGGGVTSGGTSYTQTGLVTFDLDPSAPFNVTANSAVVTNLDADKLDGQHGSYYRDASNLNAGTVPIARISGITNSQVDAAAAIAYSKLNLATSIVNADVNASAAIAWTKLSKTGSSLADLTTRSASDLSSGTVAEARLGSGTGSANKVLRGNSTWGDAPGITTDGSSRIQQIAFAATQSASSDVNTLDDYEEGTWTPSLGGNTTYTAQTGTYTKIGRMVNVRGNITVNAIGTGSTGVISGLPFTAAATTAGSIGYFASAASAFAWVGIFVNGSGTTLSTAGTSAAATGSGTPAVFFGNGTDVHFTVTYMV